jgi:flagellar motor switch protein FliN/FliY
MSELTPELAAELVAACQAGASAAADALGSVLEGSLSLSVGQAGQYGDDSIPAGFDGPGLVVLLRVGESGLAALLPEASGLLPDGYADARHQEKLNQLAQALSTLLVPSTVAVEAATAARVEHLSAALTSAGVASEAALLPLLVGDQEGAAALSLVWPLAAPESLWSAATPEGSAVAAEMTARATHRGTASLEQLPAYTKSLLRVQLPVRVILAAKKESLQNIVELAPGSIIKFDKACEEMLDLQVGNQHAAIGEAVKVGDKFGFRVNQMVLPEEHFIRVRPKQMG